MIYRDWVIRVGGVRIGFSHDLIYEGEAPYLERWIVWCGITIRLHKFHKGDDDRAFHDHPWWFITLPMQSYLESTPQKAERLVRRFRPHFRPAAHQHIVALPDAKPVWTFIVTGMKSNEWGFWDDGVFVHHEHWFNSGEQG